jgi:hypothetical protein
MSLPLRKLRMTPYPPSAFLLMNEINNIKTCLDVKQFENPDQFFYLYTVQGFYNDHLFRRNISFTFSARIDTSQVDIHEINTAQFINKYYKNKDDAEIKAALIEALPLLFNIDGMRTLKNDSLELDVWLDKGVQNMTHVTINDVEMGYIAIDPETISWTNPRNILTVLVQNSNLYGTVLFSDFIYKKNASLQEKSPYTQKIEAVLQVYSTEEVKTIECKMKAVPFMHDINSNKRKNNAEEEIYMLSDDLAIKEIILTEQIDELKIKLGYNRRHNLRNKRIRKPHATHTRDQEN